MDPFTCFLSICVHALWEETGLRKGHQSCLHFFFYLVGIVFKKKKSLNKYWKVRRFYLKLHISKLFGRSKNPSNLRSSDDTEATFPPGLNPPGQSLPHLDMDWVTTALISPDCHTANLPHFCHRNVQGSVGSGHSGVDRCLFSLCPLRHVTESSCDSVSSPEKCG